MRDIPMEGLLLVLKRQSKGISRKDIIAYFQEHYTPDNMSVVITGDFDEAKAREAISKFVKGLVKVKPRHLR